MAMALTRYPWGVSSLQVPTQHTRLTDILITRTRTLQVTCRAQRLATGKSSVGPKTKKKKKKVLNRKKVEKPGGNKKELQEKEDQEGFAVIPQMSEWKNNKPLGFGVGKEYTTSLEDELLADIEREEELRAAAEEKKKENVSATLQKKSASEKKAGKTRDINKEEQQADEKNSKPMQRITLQGDRVVERRNNKPKVEKKPPQQEEPAGVKVKLTHLPKKKNIRRDLRDAFKDVQGLLFIKPNELANKKTKDPLCKGSALLTFANEEKAKAFIEKFKARKLQFGKVERVITYELLPEKVEAQPEEVKKPVPRLQVREPVTETSTSEVEDLTVESESVTEALDSNSLDEHETEDEDEAEDDVILDAIVSASLDEDTDSESLEEEEEDDDDEDDEDDVVDEEDEVQMTLGTTKTAGFEGMELSDDLEYADSEDDESDFSEEDEEDEEEGSTRAGMDASDDHCSDEEEELSDDQLEQEAEFEPSTNTQVDGIGEEGYLEVDVSLPLSAKDLGGDPEDIISVNTEKMEELDKQISQLKKKLKRKKSKELEAQILKLREEKIELLEKRVLARFIAAREVFRAKRAAKQQDNDSKRTGRKLRVDDEKLKDVVSKHFTSQS